MQKCIKHHSNTRPFIEHYKNGSDRKQKEQDFFFFEMQETSSIIFGGLMRYELFLVPHIFWKCSRSVLHGN